MISETSLHSYHRKSFQQSTTASARSTISSRATLVFTYPRTTTSPFTSSKILWWEERRCCGQQWFALFTFHSKYSSYTQWNHWEFCSFWLNYIMEPLRVSFKTTLIHLWNRWEFSSSKRTWSNHNILCRYEGLGIKEIRGLLDVQHPEVYAYLPEPSLELPKTPK